MRGRSLTSSLGRQVATSTRRLSASISVSWPAADSVKGYVDGYVAHSDARARAALPAFDDPNFAIDSIGRLFIKYVNALTAETYATLVPEFQRDCEPSFASHGFAPNSLVSVRTPPHEH